MIAVAGMVAQELALLLAIETGSYWSLGAQENVFGITEVDHGLGSIVAGP